MGSIQPLLCLLPLLPHLSRLLLNLLILIINPIISLSFQYPLRSPVRFGPAKSLAHPLSAVTMDAPASDHKSTPQEDAVLPELLTEVMVDMKCEGCVIAVRNKLQTVNGVVKNVEVDLGNQVVRVLGKTMIEALEQTGRSARLIGQGVPEGVMGLDPYV